MRTRAIYWACILGILVVPAACGTQEKAVVEDTAATAAPASQVQVPPQPEPVTPPSEVIVPETTPLPDVLARVNGRDITRAQFEREQTYRIRMLEMRSGKSVQPNDEINSIILKGMIDNAVLTALASRAGIQVGDDEVQVQFEESKGRMGSEEAFQAYVEEAKLTQEELLALIRDSMIVGRFIEQATKDVAATDDELTAEYERLKTAGRLERKEDTTDVSHVLIKVAPGADEAAWEAGKQRADEARARVAAGEDFGTVAKEFSQDPRSAGRGGAYDEVPAGKMGPEFDEMMAKTAIGDVSEPFRTDFGWHFLTVTGRHKPGTMTLDEVKDDMGELLASTKRRQMIGELIADAEKDMNIEVLYLKDLVTAPDHPHQTPTIRKV